MLFSLIYNILCPHALAVDGTEGISGYDLIGTWESTMEGGEVEIASDNSRIQLLMNNKFSCTNQFLTSGRLQSECTIDTAVISKLDSETWVESIINVKVNFNSTWYTSGETLHTTITSSNVQIADRTVFVNNENHSQTETGNVIMSSIQKNLEQAFKVGKTSTSTIVYMSYNKYIYLENDTQNEAYVVTRK
jgi:hypothetical protein